MFIPFKEMSFRVFLLQFCFLCRWLPAQTEGIRILAEIDVFRDWLHTQIGPFEDDINAVAMDEKLAYESQSLSLLNVNVFKAETGLIARIKSNMEFYLISYITNHKFPQAAGEEFAVLEEVTNMFKSIEIKKHFLDQMKREDEGSSSGNGELFGKLQKFHLDTNMQIEQLLWKIWFKFHLEHSIKILSSEINADQTDIKIKHSLFRSLALIQGPSEEIVWTAMDQMKGELRKLFKGLENNKYMAKRQSKKKGCGFMNILQMSKGKKHVDSEPKMEQVFETTLPEEEEEKCIQLLKNLQCLENDEFPANFAEHIEEFSKIIDKSDNGGETQDDSIRKWKFAMRSVVHIARKIIENIKKAIEKKLKGNKKMAYTRISANVLMNSMSQQMLAILKKDFNNEHSNSNHFHNFILLRNFVEDIKLYLDELDIDGKKLVSKMNIGSTHSSSIIESPHLISHIKERLTYAYKIKDKHFNLYKLVMEEQNELPDQMVKRDAIKEKNEENELHIRIVLNTLQILAWYKRMERYYEQMRKAQFIKDYEDNEENKKQLKAEALEIRRKVERQMDGHPKHLHEYIYKEFVKRFETLMDGDRSLKKAVYYEHINRKKLASKLIKERNTLKEKHKKLETKIRHLTTQMENVKHGSSNGINSNISKAGKIKKWLKTKLRSTVRNPAVEQPQTELIRPDELIPSTFQHGMDLSEDNNQSIDAQNGMDSEANLASVNLAKTGVDPESNKLKQIIQINKREQNTERSVKFVQNEAESQKQGSFKDHTIKEIEAVGNFDEIKPIESASSQDNFAHLDQNYDIEDDGMQIDIDKKKKLEMEMIKQKIAHSGEKDEVVVEQARKIDDHDERFLTATDCSGGIEEKQEEEEKPEDYDYSH